MAEDVKFFISQEHKCLSYMVILEYRLIIIEQCHLVISVDQESITQPRMINVMSKCTNLRPQVFQGCQLQKLSKPTFAL